MSGSSDVDAAAAAAATAAPVPPHVAVALRSPVAPREYSFALARDVTRPAAGEAIDDAPFSCGFTGRHDDGPLPAASLGYYAHLLSAVTEAKQLTDAHLVALAASSAGGEGDAAGAGGATPHAKVRAMRHG